MKKLVLITIVLASVAGCNTVGGVGRDISSVGDTVSDAAK